MGLLSFIKKSCKQQQLLNDKPFELTHHYQPSPELPSFSNGSLSTKNTFKIESANPEDVGTSLMDDIMNELDSAKSISYYKDVPPITRPIKGNRPSPLLIFDLSTSSVLQQQQKSPLSSPQMPVNHAATTAATATAAKNPAFMSSQQHLSASTISIPALDNNKASRTSMQKQQQQQQQQQQHQSKPKPLLSFSDGNLNLKGTKDVNNKIADRDDLKFILLGKPASPPPLMQQQTQTQTAASPPAYNIATNNNISRSLMDRMKERHRLEARRSLQPSPFIDNAQAHTNKLSSPSMPIIFSATTTANSPITTSVPKDNRPSPNPLVQSHSFTTYANPSTPPIATVVTKQRPQQQQPLVRSVSDLNDMHAMATRPIQTQSDISLHKRATLQPLLRQLQMSQSPSITNVRNSYLQTGPVMSAAYEEEEDMFCAPINAVNPTRFQLNRSVSAYSSFPQQSLQQQQQLELQQRQQIEILQQQHILQQQKQQQIQQQHIQQQIGLQQQQLQEQQRMQQQKLQQLQIQQQQQQILNQTLLETTAATNAAAAAAAASAAASAASAPLKVDQHRRDTPKTAVVRSESRLIDTKHTSKSKPASKYNSAPRPLYERSSSPLSSSSLGGAECPHGRCRQQQQHHNSHCHCRSTSPNNNNNRSVVLHNSSNVPDTPPPESHHKTMFSKELTEQVSPIQDNDNSPEKTLTAIEEILIANSSTSTLTVGDSIAANTATTITTSQPTKTMSKVILLPEKLKQELQSMQLRRSTYSVPDLTTFSSDDDDDATEQQKDWSTIEMFDSSIMTNEPIKDTTSITAADMNPSQSSPELLMFDPNRHSESSFQLESDSCCSGHHHHHSQQPHHHRDSHHHHHKKHRCSKRHSTCCPPSSSRKHHHCSSSKHSTSLHKSFSTYSMDMSASVLTTSCSHQPGKRHHHHHQHHHHQANKHRGHRCHDNNHSSSRYTLTLQDDEDEDVL